MKTCCIKLIALPCMVKIQNYMASHSVAHKDLVTSLKVKITVQTYVM